MPEAEKRSTPAPATSPENQLTEGIALCLSGGGYPRC